MRSTQTPRAPRHQGGAEGQGVVAIDGQEGIGIGQIQRFAVEGAGLLVAEAALIAVVRTKVGIAGECRAVFDG